MSSSLADRPSPPSDREEVIRLAGDRGSAIFRFVRRTLNELEEAAPWDLLYYPPDDDDGLLAICRRLLEKIDDLPDRVDVLAEELLDSGEESAARDVEDIRFYFDGILMMTSAEQNKLRQRLRQPLDETGPLSPRDREEILEITADLKGKYASSVMGAAASLIAGTRWNGVELEPILFPEKAEEFERNEHLVRTLKEVLEAITDLGKEVPLPSFAARWAENRRIDQYALTPFYAFLGMLGKLMKESSRRALYSGDYHQIRKRESQLSTRVNELNTLHNTTWGIVPTDPGQELEDVYRLLERKAIEVAAILDLELLREIIGDSAVKDLHAVVTTERDGRSAAEGEEGREERIERVRSRLPPERRDLVPLLYEEDLRTFFDLLLGSVLKRASLSVTRRDSDPEPPARATPTPGEVLDIDPALLESTTEPADDASPDEAEGLASDDFDFGLPEDFGFDPLPELDEHPAPAAEGGKPELTEFVQEASDEDRREALAALRTALDEVMARGNSARRPLELLHRLLVQGKNVPPGMIQSIHPFVHQVQETLLPRVRRAAMVAGVPAAAADNLGRTCRALEGRPEPEEIQTVVASNVERLLHLLEGLDSTTSSLAREQGVEP